MVEFGSLFTGLPSTRDLADPGSNARTGLTIRVTKPRTALRTSGGASIVQPSGRLRQFDGQAPGDVIAALSRAEVFFVRPVKRADGAEEAASLYNPYWSVRLVSPTAADKAYAAAFQGAALP